MRLQQILLVIALTLIFSCSAIGRREMDQQTDHHPMQSLIDIYRNRLDHLTAVRAGECPMHPSCSEYSMQAFEKHGFFVGWMMTVERLMRCGRDEMNLSPLVNINGKWKRYDPLDANDFWWSKNQPSNHPASFESPGTTKP